MAANAAMSWRKALPKAAVAILVFAGVSWLFLETVRETNAAPYVVDAEELTGWTLGLEEPELGGPALLMLQPPVSLVADVFRQVFQRTGQSLAGPSRASMPVVLHAEYASALKGILTPEELLETARKAGLESERLQPICMGIKNVSTGGPVVQRFFILFESAGFLRFRQELSRLHESRKAGGEFEADALRPIVPIASFAPDFERWQWPLQFEAAECATLVSPRASN
jgi:hypothetical protein